MTPIKFEDGSAYLATTKTAPNGVVHLLQINEEIRTTAHRLLNAAQAMAESTALRNTFFQANDNPLRGSQQASVAQIAADAAEKRATALYFLAKGESEWSDGHVDVHAWREMLQFFNQPLDVGSIKA